jgi:hypothetical protein
MIIITIGRRKFKGVYRWDELTLSRFCDLASIPMPVAYESFILADGKYDHDNKASIDYYIEEVSKLTDKDLKEDFPAYYRKVVKCLTNIPDRYMALLNDERIERIYELHFKPFVVSLIYHTPVVSIMGILKQFEPVNIKHIDIGWQRFYLPQVVSVMNQEVPLANEPVISYTEASDIFSGMKVSREDVQRLALFMAIYCRKKREKYDQSKVLKRQELFLKAPMSIVWSVFFYTCKRLPESEMSIRLFSGLQRGVAETVRAVKIYRDMAVGV